MPEVKCGSDGRKVKICGFKFAFVLVCVLRFEYYQEQHLFLTLVIEFLKIKGCFLNYETRMKQL